MRASFLGHKDDYGGLLADFGHALMRACANKHAQNSTGHVFCSVTRAVVQRERERRGGLREREVLRVFVWEVSFIERETHLGVSNYEGPRFHDRKHALRRATK